MKSHFSVHPLPVRPTSIPEAAKHWLLAGLVALASGLLADPVAEALESPMALHAAAPEISSGPGIAPMLARLIQTTRERRTLLARQANGDVLPHSGTLTILDAQIREELAALQQHAKVLPASLAQEIGALAQDWRALEETSRSPHSQPSTLFALHGQLIDQQLLVLSHTRTLAN